MTTRKKPFILLSEAAGILVQVLIAVHAIGPANCIVVISRETRRFSLTNMTSRCIQANFDGSDDDDLIMAINRLAVEMPDLTVIPCDCPAERIVDRIGPRLNARVIPAPNAAMLDCFDDKWEFYQFCRKHGLNVPPARLIACKQDIDFHEISGELGLPIVFKPLNQAGSAGVQVIYSEQEYQRKIVEANEYQFAPLLVQQYIRGLDIGLNLLAIHGRITTIAVQQRDFPQNFGAPIEFLSSPELENAARTICESSHYHGVMNIDARVEENTRRVFLFESNPRFWGSLSASVWCGLNFVEACMEPAPPPPQVRRLHSGRASVHYHPVVQPALWSQALFSRHGHRRRMVRFMMSDLWTFLVQVKSLRQKVKRYITIQLHFFKTRN